MTGSQKLLRCTIATVAVSSAIIGAAALSAAGSDRPSASAANPPVSAIDSQQAASFSVMRRAGKPGDELSPAAADAVAKGPAPDLDANGRLARRALSAGEQTLYAVPARGALCAITGDGLAACNRTDAALAGYVVGAAGRPGLGVRVFGLIPDGTSSVTVTAESGAQTQATLGENAFWVELAEAPQSVSWQAADGGLRQIPVHLPPAP